MLDNAGVDDLYDAFMTAALATSAPPPVQVADPRTMPSYDPSAMPNAPGGLGDFYSDATQRLLDKNQVHAMAPRLFDTPQGRRRPDDAEFRDAVSIYIDEVCPTETLTFEEEMALGRRIAEGKEQILRTIMSTPLLLDWFADMTDRIESGKLTITQLISPDEETGFITSDKEDDGTNAIILSAYMTRIRKLCREHQRLLKSNPDKAEQVLGRILAISKEMNLTLSAVADLTGYVRGIAAKLDVKKGIASQLYAKYEELFLKRHSRKTHISQDGFERILDSTGESEEPEEIARRHAGALGIGADVLKGYIIIFRRNRDDANLAIGKTGLTRERLQRLSTALQLAQRSIDRAKEKLIRAHLGFTIFLAKSYQKRGVEFADLIQEGNMGLMRATDTFDYRRGYRFNTYASWWIISAIQRSIWSKERTIRVPRMWSPNLTKINMAIGKLYVELGRYPSKDELLKELDWNQQTLERNLTMVRQPISLFVPVGDDGDRTLLDYVPHPSPYTPLTDMESAELGRMLSEVLSRIPSASNEELIRLRFGLWGGRGHTLEEIGDMRGVTREAIRTAEGRTLNWLRHPSRTKHLRAFLSP